MKFVEIYNLQNDGSQKILAVCKLSPDSAECEGDRDFIGNLTEEGIIDYSKKNRPKLYPKDGLTFLEQLKNNFKSGYLNASDIKEN